MWIFDQITGIKIIEEEIINDRKSKMEFLKRTVDYVKKLEEEETDE